MSQAANVIPFPTRLRQALPLSRGYPAGINFEINRQISSLDAHGETLKMLAIVRLEVGCSHFEPRQPQGSALLMRKGLRCFLRKRKIWEIPTVRLNPGFSGIQRRLDRLSEQAAFFNAAHG